MIYYVFDIVLGSLHNLLFNPQNASKEVLFSPFPTTFCKQMRKPRGIKRELVSGEV